MASSASVTDEERQKLMEGEEVPAKKTDDKKDGTRLVKPPILYPGLGEAGSMQFPSHYLFGWESTTASGSAVGFSCSSISFSSLMALCIQTMLAEAVWPLFIS